MYELCIIEYKVGLYTRYLKTTVEIAKIALAKGRILRISEYIKS